MADRPCLRARGRWSLLPCCLPSPHEAAPSTLLTVGALLAALVTGRKGDRVIRAGGSAVAVLCGVLGRVGRGRQAMTCAVRAHAAYGDIVGGAVVGRARSRSRPPWSPAAVPLRSHPNWRPPSPAHRHRAVKGWGRCWWGSAWLTGLGVDGHARARAASHPGTLPP